MCGIMEHARGWCNKLETKVEILELFQGADVVLFAETWHFPSQHLCRNPTLAKCGGEAQHLEKLGFGVLRDSQMFRARQQDPKHLTLVCSWCHWKGLEA
jgi:hypothetical protein